MSENEESRFNQPEEQEYNNSDSSTEARSGTPASPPPQNRFIDLLTGRARRASAQQPRTYRLASSVRLPWFFGLMLFLLIALAAALLIGRTGNNVQVPQTVLNYQETVTQSAAQTVRRGANEGVEDLESFSATLSPVLPDDGEESAGLTEPLRGVAQVQERYLQLYVINEQGEIVANAANEEERDLSYDPLEIVDPFQNTGMSFAWQDEQASVPIILQYATLPTQEGPDRAVVGWYDPAFFEYSLETAGAGEAWLVNERGQVIGARQGFTAFQELPRQALREAAARAADGESGTTVVSDSPSTPEIVSFAPVAGGGPAGSLDWSVVTARSVNSISLPETNARRQGLTIAAITALGAVVIFGWLWLQVLRPLFKLQREAERLAYGDLSRGVEVVRYDELGLTARALERIRILLVRRRIQGEDQQPRSDDTTGKED